MKFTILLIAGPIWQLFSANTESVHTSIELKDLKTTLPSSGTQNAQKIVQH